MNEQVNNETSAIAAEETQPEIVQEESRPNPYATIAEVLAASEQEQSEPHQEWQQRMNDVEERLFGSASAEPQEPPTLTSSTPLDELVEADMSVEEHGLSAPIMATEEAPKPKKKKPSEVHIVQFLTEEQETIKKNVVLAMQTVFDPEIPVDIYQLGLIYNILFDDDNNIRILMTLTSPNCPEAQTLPAEIELVSSKVEGVKSAQIEIVWEPPWDPSMMSEEAQLQLGFF